MKYIIQNKFNNTYFSDGTTRWTSEKSKAFKFDSFDIAQLRMLSIASIHELQVIEYGK